MSPAKSIPDGFHTVTPHLTVSDGNKALDFYKEAFGAEEISRMQGPGGTLMHGEVKIGDSIVMLAGEMPGGDGGMSPATLGGTAVTITLYVQNVDAIFDRAVKAGAKVRMPVGDMFWGDRYGQVEDPFGHVWAMATHKEDLTPKEINKRAEEFYAKQSS